MNFTPTNVTTEIISKHVWKVNSIDGLLSELSSIEKSSLDQDKLIIYRGHRDERWLLDSTFVRSFKTTLFGIEPFKRLNNRITDSAEFHPAILNLYLLKFGVLTRPSDDLESSAKEHGLDSWFEWMKRLQQYPGEDGFFLKGSNLIDWSQSTNVALYFANENRTSDGALFICDASATGKTLQRIKLGAILDKMKIVGNSGQSLGVPLLFHPDKQIANKRSDNQQAVYFAQMDLGYDLQYMWDLYEKENSSDPICLKIILPSSTIKAIESYLKDEKIDSKYIYSDDCKYHPKPAAICRIVKH